MIQLYQKSYCKIYSSVHPMVKSFNQRKNIKGKGSKFRCRFTNTKFMFALIMILHKSIKSCFCEVPYSLITKQPAFDDILKASGSDKMWRHHYEKYYRRWLDPYRSKVDLKLLEIGADEGKSLQAWDDFFTGPNKFIVGLAYGQSSEGVEARFDRNTSSTGVHVVRGDQSDKNTLHRLCQLGPFDIVVDDGSHVPAHVITSFVHLFKGCVRPGGMYIIEDIETSYWNGSRKHIYGYELKGSGVGESPRTNAVEKFKQLIDVLVMRTVGFEGGGVIPGDDEICSITFGENILAIGKCSDDDFHATKGIGDVDNNHMMQWVLQARSSNPILF